MPDPSARAEFNAPTTGGRGEVISWALYDWANSAFATTVMAGFFPVFFKRYWSADVEVSTTTLRLGVVNALASLVIALLAPWLGAMADAGGRRKRWLGLFTVLGVISTAALSLVGEGQHFPAAFFYLLASLGFMGGIVFYDALLVAVAPPERQHRASALGYALGYLGGGLLFALNVFMTLKPEFFGLADAAEAVRFSFVSVAVWWGLWSLPLFVRVREPRGTSAGGPLELARQGLRELRGTLLALRKHRTVAAFLLAYWLYIDGVGTIIRMAVDYGLSIGLESKDLMAALLLTQFVGFPAAVVFGRLGERLGAQRAILSGLGVYVGVTVYAAFMQSALGFFILAGVVGLVQGGVQALSRSLYAQLIPANKATEFFGFYNMLGKFAAILGPLLMGAVSALSGSPRWSIASVLALLVGGGVLLYRLEVDGPAPGGPAAPA